MHPIQRDRFLGTFRQLGYSRLEQHLRRLARAVVGQTALRFIRVILLLVVAGVFNGQATAQPTARRGVLDLRKVDWTQQDVELTGEWKWYWHQLRLPNAPRRPSNTCLSRSYGLRATGRNGPYRVRGYATYALTVLLPPQSPPLTLQVPAQNSAYRLFVNGKELAHDGNPATTPAETRPHWSVQLVRLPPSADTLELLLQIANFEHARGGSSRAIRLGSATRLEAGLAMSQALDLFLTGCLFMSGLFFLGLFRFSRTERANLYFGLFCLAYSYRVVGTDHYVLHTLLPDLPWGLTLRLQYVSLYLAVGAFVRYTESLYPKDGYSRVNTVLIWVCLAFTGTALLLPPVVFTQLMNSFLLLMVSYIGYACHVYWIATRRKRPGAAYSLLSTGLLLGVFGLMIAHYFGVATPPEAGLFIGCLGFFFLQSLVLSFRFAFALNEARQTEKQFLANMSHEIRTPLNAILGFSTLLEATTLKEDQQEFVRHVRTAGKNLLMTVNDILDVAKIESGNLQLETIPFSVHLLVDSIRTMLLPAATDKRLTFTADVDPALPLVLLGDPTRLTQILLNLLSNAIKFTQQGSVRVRVRKKEATADSVRVRFTVEDSGIGMAADVLPHIFERYRQADNSTTRYYGGTGLGLSIVKSLIQLQGGRVKVTSTPGQGSCFTVDITYAISQNPADQPSSETAPTTWEPAERGLSILVVEDNAINQKLAVGVLNRFGHTPQVVENGQRALDRLREETFDLVLMDIQMPVMDGYTATYHIRNTLRSQVPIIAMTAHALASEREKCLQAGMNDFLSKPFQPDDLQQLILKHMPHSHSEDRLAEPAPSPAEPTPGFSMDPLLEVVGGEMAIAIELLELFLSQTAEQIGQIRQALSVNDRATISRVIHTQKAAIQLLELNQASQQIRTLEALLATEATLTEAAPLVEQLLLTLEAALPAVDSFVQSALGQTTTDG